jgi:peptidoglycan/LPS O-acetylase OafA/YrhL
LEKVSSPLEGSRRLYYYPFLDGLRAISIFLVIGHHVNVFFNIKPMLGRFYLSLSTPMFLGFMGVDIFFVISGFLITGLILESTHRLDILRFYIRRIFKIMPSYLLVVFATYLIFRPAASDSSFFNYLFMVQNYTTIYDPLGHLWSIAVEEHFYIIYPIFIYLIYLMVRDQKKFQWALIAALAVMIGLGNWIRYYNFSHFPIPHAPWLWQKSHVRFDALLMGALIKCLEPYLSPKGKWSQRFFSWGALIMACLLIFSLKDMPASSMRWFDYTKIYLFAALFVVSCLIKKGWLYQFLSFAPLRWIGKNSYGIYLWHYPVLLLMLKFPGVTVDQGPWVLAYIVLALAAGILSTHTIERYFLWLREKVKP